MKRAIRNTMLVLGTASICMMLAPGSKAMDRGRFSTGSGYYKETRMDRAAIADDIADLDRLSDLVMEWNYLRRSGAGDRETRAAFARIARELRRDLGENHAQLMQARAETRRSARNLRHAVRYPGRFGDLIDDMRDERQARDLLVRKREITRELISIQKRIDRTYGKDRVLASRQMRLLEEYLKLSRREIAMGFRELREDRWQIREVRYDARTRRGGRR
jgi:hypothetical protein